LAVKQQHGETEDERTSDRRSVTTEGQDASDPEQDPESESLRLLHVTKGGGERVNLLQFLKALLEAEGMTLDGTAAERGRDGRSAGYRLAVQANGQLLIGTAYTEQMALKPGDAFELVLGRKHIQLKQLGPIA
jgi:hypothetical protein